jgi:hypothetical protein
MLAFGRRDRECLTSNRRRGSDAHPGPVALRAGLMPQSGNRIQLRDPLTAGKRIRAPQIKRGS